MSVLKNPFNPNQTLELDFRDSSNITEIDNDYFQQQIYNEVRRNNSFIELWKHIFGIFGCLISIFGIIGN